MNLFASNYKNMKFDKTTELEVSTKTKLLLQTKL